MIKSIIMGGFMRNTVKRTAAALVVLCGLSRPSQGQNSIHLQGTALPQLSGITRSASFDRKSSDFASGTGNILFLLAGVGLPLLEDGKDGKQHALRAADALASSVLISEGLKLVTREERPNHGGYDSLPSGHTTAAFAIATAQSAFHPSQAPLWYAGAAYIGYSRVRLNEHYIHDVIAGAAIGYATARWELSRKHGLLLTPWIGPENSRMGVQLAGRF
jgi:hypothetical protein